MVLAALSGACTILTACSKFLVADRKKAGHKRFAKLFQTLLIRMLRCETTVEYNALRHELTEAIIREPLVLIWQRRKTKTKLNYTMTHRLALVCIPLSAESSLLLQKGFSVRTSSSDGCERVDEL
jgi:hypothetical protein